MEWGILNLGMLFGLAALSVPVLIHLLQRRRHDVVAWGAMQFLPSNVATRRRRWWDELPLMLLRMGLIALVVFALAGPYSTSAVFAPLSERPPRDVVIVLDGSFSMDRRDEHGQTPWGEACRWTAEQVAQMGRGERAALIVARRPPLKWQPTLTADRGLLNAKLAELPPPRGNAGLPQALAEAWRLLREQSNGAERDIVALTDRQYYGWADDASLQAWGTLARQLQSDAESVRGAAQVPPRLIVVDVARDAGRLLPIRALAPLTSSRALVAVGQHVKFSSALYRDAGTRRERPGHLRVKVDGLSTQEVPWPGSLDAKIEGRAAAQIPLNFTVQFDKAGLHVVTLTLEPHEAADALAADNEQHAVVEVVADFPVLLVDGDRQPSPESSTFFVEKALAGGHQHSIVMPRVVPVTELTAAHILGATPQTRPRVIVLADVPELTATQQESVDTYLQAGGNVLVTLGPRVRPSIFNDRFYRQGQGWLPARLIQVVGEAGGAGERPELKTFQHPALELFRKAPGGGLGQVAFSRWWKVAVEGQHGGIVAARLGNADPLLVEKVFGKGRVILCSAPMDRGWNSPLPGTWEFPVLIHELVFYLAGARADAWLLADGQPMRVMPGSGEGIGRLIVQTPEISRTVQVRAWPWTDADTGAIGLYRVEREDGSRQFFVVPPDVRESEDRRCTDEEWQRVLTLLPMRTITDDAQGGSRRHELWWLILLGVIALLCVEVLLTRRLALGRRPVHVAR